MSDAVHDFLADSAPDVRTLALEIRALVRRLVPDAQEDVRPGWRSIGYSHDGTLKSSVCAIIPHRAHVNVQFLQGTELDDPAGRLEGTGKRGRHVKVRSEDDIDESLAALIERAATYARPARPGRS